LLVVAAPACSPGTLADGLKIQHNQTLKLKVIVAPSHVTVPR
jgi:hypothetical protein